MWHIGRKREYKLHQWANDWVTVLEESQPFSPTAFVYTIWEITRMQKDVHAGMFWQWHELVSDIRYKDHGGFRLKKRKPTTHKGGV